MSWRIRNLRFYIKKEAVISSKARNPVGLSALNVSHCAVGDFSLHFVPFEMTITSWVEYAQYWVYIMTNQSRTLYTGVTSNLVRRVFEHRSKQIEGFTKRYSITQLVYFEEHNNIRLAITREKQIKDWARAKKIVLIEGFNSQWRDLGDEILRQ